MQVSHPEAAANAGLADYAAVVVAAAVAVRRWWGAGTAGNR
jgi:hypothetical protein